MLTASLLLMFSAAFAAGCHATTDDAASCRAMAAVLPRGGARLCHADEMPSPCHAHAAMIVFTLLQDCFSPPCYAFAAARFSAAAMLSATFAAAARCLLRYATSAMRRYTLRYDDVIHLQFLMFTLI